MPLSLQEYQAKLISKILLSKSHDEVKRYIDTAVKKLEEHGIDGHIVARFIDKTMDELEGFSPVNETVEQWSNIKIAKVLLFRIQRQMKIIKN